MEGEASLADSIRHRLLEAVLVRLAQRPNAGGLALRGGMLLRHWLPPRTAADLDLVAPAALTIEETHERYLSLFADHSTDSATFDTDRIRLEAIWRHTANPGVRIHARGRIDSHEADVQIDITGGPPPRPAAVWLDLPTAWGLARVWACRPETVVGHKVQALVQLGAPGWRPKDLDDLQQMLERLPMDGDALRESVEAYLNDIGRTVAEAHSTFAAAPWWGTKSALARWNDHMLTVRGRRVPASPAEVAAAVALRLTPVWEGS